MQFLPLTELLDPVTRGRGRGEEGGGREGGGIGRGGGGGGGGGGEEEGVRGDEGRDE